MRLSVPTSICAIIAGFSLIPAPVCAAALAPFTVSQSVDARMDCHQLSNEAFIMKSIIAQTRNQRQGFKMQTQGIGVVGTAASFVVGSVTGGLGIAAAGLFARHATDQAGDHAEIMQEVAQQRRTLMIGMFNGKGCVGPIEGALQDAPMPSELNQIAAAAGDARPAPPRNYNQ